MTEQVRGSWYDVARAQGVTAKDTDSRYIIAWKLYTTMRAADVTDTLELALAASGCHSAKVAHKPRLPSDNGSSYISSELAEWLKDRGLPHVRGAPCHPQTEGKIERWHQRLALDCHQGVCKLRSSRLPLERGGPPALHVVSGRNETHAPF
jgi:transposase InsO family protein